LQTLIKNGLILTLDRDDRVHERCDVLIAGDSIAQIGSGLAAPTSAKVIDAADKLVLPGFVNAHLHSYDLYDKSLYEDLPLEVWLPYTNLGVRRPLTKHEIRVRTLLAATEMLRSGITTAYDNISLFPLDQDSVDAVMTAYRDSGIRAVVGVTMANKPFSQTMPYLDELMPPEIRKQADGGPIPPDSELLGFCRWMIDRWNGKEGRLHTALSPSAPQRCTDRFMGAMDALSQEQNIPWNTHVLETKVQAVTGTEFYGKTIVEHLSDLGLLTHRLTIDHGIWLTARDMQLLAEAGTSVAHNPVSNARLRSGIAPIRSMLAAGVNVALGTDNGGAADALNMFQTMKLAALLPEFAGTRFGTWEPAREILRMATGGGAKTVALQDSIASLEVGKKADIVLIDLTTIPFTPLNSPVRQLVYGENGQSVDTVLVNGQVVMENGNFLNLDEAALRKEARGIGDSWRIERSKAEQFAGLLRPYLEAMYRRCVAQDVGMNRFSQSEEG
jgi:5-methylthioadenosine/S-adenosylhomocysteine deaminase